MGDKSFCVKSRVAYCRIAPLLLQKGWNEVSKEDCDHVDLRWENSITHSGRSKSAFYNHLDGLVLLDDKASFAQIQTRLPSWSVIPTFVVNQENISNVIKSISCHENEDGKESGFKGGWWVVKDALVSSGICTSIVRSLHEFDLSLIQSNRTYVLQPYLMRPALWRGRKFDVRSYIIVTHSRKVYAWKPCFLRIASEPFNLDDPTNPFVHMTNTAIQKQHPLFGKLGEHDNQVSCFDCPLFVCTCPNNQCTNSIAKDNPEDICIFSRMCSILHEFMKQFLPALGLQWTFENGQTEDLKLQNGITPCHFELLGVDWLIDEANRPWLLEINRSPNLAPCAPKVEVDVLRPLFVALLNLVLSNETALHPDLAIVYSFDHEQFRKDLQQELRQVLQIRTLERLIQQFQFKNGKRNQ